MAYSLKAIISRTYWEESCGILITVAFRCINSLCVSFISVQEKTTATPGGRSFGIHWKKKKMFHRNCCCEHFSQSEQHAAKLRGSNAKVKYDHFMHCDDVASSLLAFAYSWKVFRMLFAEQVQQVYPAYEMAVAWDATYISAVYLHWFLYFIYICVRVVTACTSCFDVHLLKTLKNTLLSLMLRRSVWRAGSLFTRKGWTPTFNETLCDFVLIKGIWAQPRFSWYATSTTFVWSVD